MKGEIHVDSTPGEGSLFQFSLPLKKQTLEEVRSMSESNTLVGKHVLVVDGNELSQRHLGSNLDQWGCRYRAAFDESQALDFLKKAEEKKDPLHFAIIDQMPPKMTGEALAEKIKASPHFNKTILIMMTSGGYHGDTARIKKMGFSAYLTKPVKLAELFHCLIKGISHHSHNSQSIENGKSQHPLIPRYLLKEEIRNQVQILVVEDNPVNQKVAVMGLTRMGYRVNVASNGYEAIDAIRQTPYDMVFMDMQMPELDGIEATRRIRSDKNIPHRNLPIIALTASALTEDRNACKKAGMDDFLSKPVTLEKLNALVEKWLSTSISSPTPFGDPTNGCTRIAHIKKCS